MEWRSVGSLSHRSLYSNSDSNLHFSASLSYRPALTYVLKVDPADSLPFSPSRLYDATVHRCMINSKETWEREAQPMLRRLEHARAEEESKRRNGAAEIEIRGLRMEVDSVRCFLLYSPAYVLTYQQMNADSYVVVNASTAQVAGDVHYSRQRVAAVLGVAGALVASLLGWPVVLCALLAAAAGVAAAAYAPVARTIHFKASRARMFAKLDEQRGRQFEYFGWEYTRPTPDDFSGYSSYRTHEQQHQRGNEKRGQRGWSWSWDWDSGSARGGTSHEQQGTEGGGEQGQRSRESSWGGGGTSTARAQAPDYYVVLGVPRSGTTQQIKDAYRREALKWHPDMQSDGVKKKAAEERFKVLNDAYRTLRDENARRQYDRMRA